MSTLYPLDARTPHKDLVLVGMEPKEEYQLLRAGAFARQVPLEFPSHPEAGGVVGPLFYRISTRVGVSARTFFDFSGRLLSSDSGKVRKEGGDNRPGNSSVTIKKGDFFFRGARSSLQRMRRGPCTFVTVSRNFASWVEFGCPSPSLVDVPAFYRWTGRTKTHRRDGTELKQPIYNLLSNASAPPVGEIEVVHFSQFDHEHVMILLPNPCVPQHFPGNVTSEKKCVELLRTLLFL